MAAPSLRLVSTFPPAECAARLERFVSGDATVSATERPLLGFVSETNLRVRQNTSRRSGAQRALIGTLEPHEGGTLIRARFVMHPAAKWVLRIVGAFFTAAAVFVAAILIEKRDWRSGLIAMTGAAVAALFVDPILLGGHLVQPSQLDFVKRVLREAIDARDA